MRVGIFAGSSCVPEVEFAAGLEHLRANGFEPVIHPQVWGQKFIFPGSDEDRAGAIYDFAINDSVPILWAARGGYGAGRLLPILDQLTKKLGKPKQKKLLIGYSDVTVLHEFVRSRWGWSTLHAPMPAASNFGRYDSDEWKSLLDYVQQKPTAPPWVSAKLSWMVNPPTKDLRGELVGGNLSLWAALVGTPWFGSAKNKIIFLEDTDEPFYRMDRMMVQIEQAGGFNGAAAVVLGDFTNCKDENNTCLARAGSDERKPLRKVFDLDQAIEEIFVPIGKRTGVPFAKGLPVGHGPNFAPLPLGATYELSASGKLKLLEWDWLSRASNFVA
jgi:muramoyltetrapeptide carboxypeptidase